MYSHPVLSLSLCFTPPLFLSHHVHDYKLAVKPGVPLWCLYSFVKLRSARVSFCVRTNGRRTRRFPRMCIQLPSVVRYTTLHACWAPRVRTARRPAASRSRPSVARAFDEIACRYVRRKPNTYKRNRVNTGWKSNRFFPLKVIYP